MTVASAVKIWRHDNLPTVPMVIDPNGPTANGVLLGYQTKRILFKAGTLNGGNVHLWDQSTSPGMYFPLDSGQEVELLIDSSLLVRLSGSVVGQEVMVIMELKVA